MFQTASSLDINGSLGDWIGKQSVVLFSLLWITYTTWAAKHPETSAYMENMALLSSSHILRKKLTNKKDLFVQIFLIIDLTWAFFPLLSESCTKLYVIQLYTLKCEIWSWAGQICKRWKFFLFISLLVINLAFHYSTYSHRDTTFVSYTKEIMFSALYDYFCVDKQNLKNNSYQ